MSGTLSAKSPLAYGEELKQPPLAELRREIVVGIDQADKGQFIDGPRGFGKIRQRSAQRKRANG